MKTDVAEVANVGASAEIMVNIQLVSEGVTRSLIAFCLMFNPVYCASDRSP